MSVSDSLAATDVIDRCNDGSDHSLVLFIVAEVVVITGVDRLTTIEPVGTEVASRHVDKT